MNLATAHQKDDDITSIVPAVVPAVGHLHPVSRRTRTLTRTSSSIYSVERHPSSIDRCAIVNCIYILLFPFSMRIEAYL